MYVILIIFNNLTNFNSGKRISNTEVLMELISENLISRKIFIQYHTILLIIKISTVRISSKFKDD